MPSDFCMTEPRARRIAWLARWALALMFFWHGLVPKILWLSPDEVAMIQAHGMALQDPARVAWVAGVLEMVLALLLVTVRTQRWPVLVAGTALLALLLDVLLFSPHLLLQAFNPLSTNLAGLALCLIAWLADSPPAAARVRPH